MAAVTSEESAVSGCSVSPLGVLEYRAMAEPAFAARWFPEGATESALSAAPFVDFDRRDTLQHEWLREMSVAQEGVPRHYVPASHDYALAVTLGLGWGMVPLLQESSGLVPLGGPTLRVQLFWQQWNLRSDLLDTIAEEIAAGTFDPHSPNREDNDAPEFSRRVGAKGWLGMTWPKKYGGQERSFLERYVVTEEMRVANAPTRRFFVADRQSGPVLLKYAPEHIKMDILPRICRGEVCFAIGMSEPNSGSDLFAAKTRATKTDGGYLVNGTKIWTSSAHIADYMIAIFRTSPPTKENRRHGLTQFLVKMKQPGIQVNPIGQITGQFEFNEVVFTDYFVPDDHVLGEVDGAWKQATSELAYERSGPERFLETYYVLTELVRAVGKNPDTRSAEGIGRLVAQVHTMRRMSVSVAGMLQAGKEPVVEASIVKDIGTVWEQQLPHRVRDLAAFVEETATNRETLEKQLDFAIKTAPKLTIQGGTTEVLRGIIARGLGLR